MSVDARVVAGPRAVVGGATLPRGRMEIISAEIGHAPLGEVMVELGRDES